MAGVMKPVVFAAGLLPLGYCIWQVVSLSLGKTHQLGADPGEAIVLFNGEWALRFLLLTLCVTPVRQIFHWPEIARIRRMLGLFCFTYAVMHVCSYIAFLLEFQFSDLFQDVLKRPYITVGFTALMGLIPLAATSNRWMVRRLKQRWRTLHRLIYIILPLVLVHLIWLTRSDYTQAIVYSVVGALLLAYRLRPYLRRSG